MSYVYYSMVVGGLYLLFVVAAPLVLDKPE